MATLSNARSYQPSLTALRGVAALLVLGYHTWLFAGGPAFVVGIGNFSIDFSTPLRCGYFGVDLFFVLSGFLLSRPFLRAFARREPLPSLREYWLHRCRRVLPAFWVQLAILIGVGIATAALTVPARDLVAHALLVQNLVPWRTTTINPVYWSMPVEWDFYLFLPLIAWLVARCRGWLVALLVLVWVIGFRLLCYASLFDPAWQWLSFSDVHQLPARADQFFFGVLAAHVTLDRPQALRHAGKWLAAGLAGIVVMMIVAAPRGDFLVRLDMPYLLFHHSLVAAAFAAIVFGAAGASRIAERLIANAPLRWFGLISYSLYLWHYPLLSAMRALGWFDGSRIPQSFAALLALVPIVLIAWLSYHFVERPFLRGTAPVRAEAHDSAASVAAASSEK